MTTGALCKLLGYQMHRIGPRLCYHKPYRVRQCASLAAEVARGLRLAPRSLSPKLLYNRTGMTLFDRICGLPEYYLTRAEIGILRRIRDVLPAHLPRDCRLVELGSGSAVKTRLILEMLDAVQDDIEFIPIDISEALEEISLALLVDYPRLRVTGVMDDFDHGLEFVRRYGGGPNLIAFLGSSLGNFEPHNAQALLGRISAAMAESDTLLMGLDLVKERSVLERAYNDSQGVTAMFNLNLLSMINEELRGDFALNDFEHRCIFNPERSRMEMYIRSKRKQAVSIAKLGMRLQLEEGELIHTEHSHKYTLPGIREMLEVGGLETRRIWQDEENRYCVVLACRP